MMKKHSFILWAALTMTSVFTACTNEDSLMTEQTVTKTATIHATIEGDLGSRVALTDDVDNRVVKVDWATDDAFKINVNDADYTFTYTGNNEFECSDDNFPATFTSAGTVTATYPANTPSTAYANQPGTLESAAALLTMTATLEVTAGQNTEDLALNFKHNNSIVKLTLKNEAFKGENVTGIVLKSGSSPVATATGNFTGDAENGSIVVYFAVAPQEMTDISIHAVCEDKNYITTLTDNELGTGKLYNVNKTLVGIKTTEQAVKYDLAMADGTFISKDDIEYLTDALKGKVRGIVFWTESEDGTATLIGDNADKIMQTDFPNYNHGLIVSLKDVSQGTKWQESYTKIADWQSSTAFNPENKNDYESIASNTGTTDPINYILGYQYTKILEAYNASLEAGSNNTVLPVSLLAEFSDDNPAPANTTGWFIPSEKELTLLCGTDVDNIWISNSGGTDTKTAMNTILTSLGDTYAHTFGDNYYWSSSESAVYEDRAFCVGFSGGAVNYGYYYLTNYVRAVCAY